MADMWVKVMGQGRVSRSWVNVMGQGRGSRSWVKVVGQGHGRWSRSWYKVVVQGRGLNCWWRLWGKVRGEGCGTSSCNLVGCGLVGLEVGLVGKYTLILNLHWAMRTLVDFDYKLTLCNLEDIKAPLSWLHSASTWFMLFRHLFYFDIIISLTLNCAMWRCYCSGYTMWCKYVQ